MKTLLLTFTATFLLFPICALAEDVSENANLSEDVVQKCYDTCMPEKSFNEPAISLMDYKTNRMACQSECSNSGAEKDTATTEDTGASNRF